MFATVAHGPSSLNAFQEQHLLKQRIGISLTLYAVGGTGDYALHATGNSPEGTMMYRHTAVRSRGLKTCDMDPPFTESHTNFEDIHTSKTCNMRAHLSGRHDIYNTSSLMPMTKSIITL